ncbi:hypothetical protein JK182_04400 [Acetobacter okinawensis]|uniref:hypothetical protein n=1 Tax=Acetobacter okinawensis TaxID=1076594 RepID=UPI001BA6E562|nr:hypothetical protein [Acetobacter okinawensis]MBS0987924.1 hypothetical protein [Acetobacter okinawensis]
MPGHPAGGKRPEPGACAFPSVPHPIGHPAQAGQPFAPVPRPCHARAIFHHATVPLTTGETHTVRPLRPLLSALLVCLSAGLCIMATQNGPLPPTIQGSKTEHVLHMTTHDSAAQTATTLSRPHGWDEVMHALAQGKPEAAHIVASVLPKADTRTTRTLVHTMRTLLPRQPATVLSASEVNRQAAGSAANICSPVGMSAAWRRQATQAVTTVHDIKLATRTQTCLRTLQNTAHGA